MRASGIEGDRVFQLQGGIHRYMEEFKDGGLFMGKVSVGWSLLMGKVGVQQWQETLHQGHAGRQLPNIILITLPRLPNDHRRRLCIALCRMSCSTLDAQWHLRQQHRTPAPRRTQPARQPFPACTALRHRA